MSQVKIAVIGAGSFVFGPGVLKGVLREQRLPGVRLALMDVRAEPVELMAAVGRRMAAEAGLDTAVSAHTDRAEALDGADFVFCCAAPEMARRFRMDVDIAARHDPGHVITEFGGIAGISYSLRQIAFIESLAADMKRLCPSAWLFNVANPLPRVCQAAHQLGVPTVGFCYVYLGGYSMLWRVFHGEGLAYPFAAAPEKWLVTTAGLNHFSWVLALRDRATGADLLGELRDRLAAGATSGEPHADEIFRKTGYLLAIHDGHSQDFLPPHPSAASHEAIWHGSPEERRARQDLLADVARGAEPAEKVTANTSWEKPVDLVAAMAYGKPIEFPALNLANRGQIGNLPAGVFVETPCTAGSDGPAPRTLTLPETVEPYCRRTAEVTDTIVRAALRRNRALVHRAVELDPTITDKPAGLAALDECLAAHADRIGDYT